MTSRKLSDHAILDTANEVPFIAFPALLQIPFIKHGFSTRLGGVSEGMYSTMNLGFENGDLNEKVIENFRRIAGSIGFDENNLVFTDQVHKAEVRVAVKADRGKGILYPRDYKEIDGQITNEPNLPLLVYAADCVPLYFVDRKKRVIGLSHSGWKGTVQKIGKETVRRMCEEYGSNPNDIVAVIGPSIGKECYVVSEEVAVLFQEAFPYLTSLQEHELLEKKEDTTYLLNLWAANRFVLLEAGIPDANITLSGVCTMCHSDLLFSHRATQGKRGSMAGFLMLCE